MNILITGDIRRAKDIAYFEAFLELFPGHDLFIKLSDRSTLKVSSEREYSPDSKPDIDVVLGFQKEGLKIARKLLRAYDFIPLLYIIYGSETDRSDCNNWGGWQKIVILNDMEPGAEIDDIPKALYFKLDLPLKRSTKRERLRNFGKRRILLSLERNNEHTNLRLIKDILPPVNRFDDLQISVTGLRKLKNIEFNSSAADLPESAVESEDGLVIGYGQTIRRAIQESLPCIVVGPRGFGGLITDENYRVQQQSGFYGRPGGEIGEYIPQELLYEELAYYFGLGNELISELVRKNAELQFEEYQIAVSGLLAMISGVVEEAKNVKNNLGNLRLKLTELFRMNKHTDDSYLLCKVHNNYNYSLIGHREYDLLSRFIRVYRPVDILSAPAKQQDKSELFDFIFYLWKEKVLTVYDEK